MDQSAVFLAGSVLTMMGLIVIVAGAIVINNLINKFWKPVRIFTEDSFMIFGSHSTQSARFLTQEEYDTKVAPYLEETDKSKNKQSDQIDKKSV